MLHTYIIVFVSQLVFIVVLLGEDIYRVIYSFTTSYINGKPQSLTRSPIISEVGIFLAAIPFVAFIYGIVKGKYRYKVHKHTLHFDDLPEEFDGFTITQISDVHAGSFNDPAAVQRGIDLVNKQKSDLFVFTGDLVNNEATEIEPWINHFKQIEATEGKYSILGNHDYGDYVPWNSLEEKRMNLETLKSHHETIGFQLLLDEHVTIRRNGHSIKLVGIENWGVGFGKRGDLNKALSGVSDDEFKILLSHDPSHWTEEVKHHQSNIHLTLSGHTHGMQFGIEKFGIKWSPVKLRYKHWAGLLQENSRYLYVNRGFGFLGFSGRVGIWPEITVLELKKK
jgi:predicted MPP superfamily phosphohydrolase